MNYVVQRTANSDFGIKYFENRFLDAAAAEKDEFKTLAGKVCNFLGLMQPTPLLETFT